MLNVLYAVGAISVAIKTKKPHRFISTEGKGIVYPSGWIVFTKVSK